MKNQTHSALLYSVKLFGGEDVELCFVIIGGTLQKPIAWKVFHRRAIEAAPGLLKDMSGAKTELDVLALSGLVSTIESDGYSRTFTVKLSEDGHNILSVKFEAETVTKPELKKRAKLALKLLERTNKAKLAA